MTQKAREARKGKIKKEEGTRLSDLRKVLTRNCEPHTQGRRICRKGREKRSSQRHVIVIISENQYGMYRRKQTN